MMGFCSEKGIAGDLGFVRTSQGALMRSLEAQVSHSMLLTLRRLAKHEIREAAAAPAAVTQRMASQ